MSLRETEFNPLKAPILPNRQELERMGKVVQRVSSIGGQQVRVGGEGVLFQTKEGDWLWAKIVSSTNDIPPKHSWIQQQEREDGTFLTPAGAIEGSTTEFPAYEANGRRIPNNEVVKLYKSFGSWMYAEYCCGVKVGNATTTTSGPTTTTTTLAPCTGNCSFVWDNGTQRWSLIASTCSAGCSCNNPSYCGMVSGERTSTYCAHNPSPLPSACGCTTTTTTTAAPGTTSPPVNCGQCKYHCYQRPNDPINWYYYQSEFCLNNSCNCLPPNCSSCGEVITTCYQSGTSQPTTTQQPCIGNCVFIYSAQARTWVKTQDCPYQSFRIPPKCNCNPPTFPGVDCQVEYTECFDGCIGTTRPPVGCTGTCMWKWTSGAWVVQSTNCNAQSCACYSKPIYNGTVEGETAIRPCSPTTTTTTAAPTTTTTTCAPTTTLAPTCGQCTFQWTGTNSSGFWSVISSNCTGGCACNPPSYNGNTGCTNRVVTPCESPCGTTGSPCSAPLPPSSQCGTCTHIARPVYEAGCSRLNWYLHSNNCAFSCSCPTPTCEPLAINETRVEYCTGAGATTTLAPTTTTTTTLPPGATTPPPTECCSCGRPDFVFFGISGADCPDFNGPYSLSRVNNCLYQGFGQNSVMANLLIVGSSATLTLTSPAQGAGQYINSNMSCDCTQPFTVVRSQFSPCLASVLTITIYS